jgi:hypothetical protein
VIPLPLRYPALVAALSTLSIAAAADFHDHIGMQLWSMRAMTLAHPDAALAAVHDYGITEVETAGTANRTAEQFAASLKAHQLVAVGAHEGWDRLAQDLPGVIREAKALGVTEVICPMLPQKVLPLDEASARRVAAQFNAWGRALAAEGLRFGSHTHGMEFRPLGNGTADTAFDVLVRETRPEWVNFEMDVFWVRHGGGDPVALLRPLDRPSSEGYARRRSDWKTGREISAGRLRGRGFRRHSLARGAAGCRSGGRAALLHRRRNAGSGGEHSG